MVVVRLQRMEKYPMRASLKGGFLMYLGIPGQIANVDVSGVKRDVSIAFIASEGVAPETGC